MSDKTIVIVGAGRIGRGFVADLFAAAGYGLVLVDQSHELVGQLRVSGRYTVVHAERATRRQDTIVTGYTALTTDEAAAVDAAVAAADLVAVAVFPKDFDAVARQLASGILRRRAQDSAQPLNIILCTNLPQAGPQFLAALREAVPAEALGYLETQVGVVETLVIRMVADPPAEESAREPLLVWTNGYGELPVDRHAFKGTIPELPCLRLVQDMRAEEVRKLYTYNMCHAVLAYLGARRGHRFIVDCLADAVIRAAAEAALDEASRALQAEYGFSPQAMAAWTAGVIAQTDNPLLGDTVVRFGADPRRKLARDDRLVGPALLALKHRVPAPSIVRAIAAGLLWDDPRDPGSVYVHDELRAVGLRAGVQQVCGLAEGEEDLISAIVQDYRRLPMEEEWAARAQRAYDLGFEYEKLYHGCGQCTLAAVLDTIGRPAAEAFAAATGVCGGLGLAGDASCSALTGAVLAIGLIYPRRRERFGGDQENKYRTFELVQQLRQRFLDAYGGLICHDVQRHGMGRAFDLRDPEERVAFEEAGAHRDKCTGVVARAARWAVEIIGRELIADALQADPC